MVPPSTFRNSVMANSLRLISALTYSVSYNANIFSQRVNPRVHDVLWQRPLHPGDPDRPGSGEGHPGRARLCPGDPPPGLRPADQDPVPAAARVTLTINASAR